MKGLSTFEKGIWENEMLTVKEVADYFRVGRVTVWRWCKQGLIPATQIGHHWRIHRDDLLELFENKQQRPALGSTDPHPLLGVQEDGSKTDTRPA